jgi:hypothetical protein
MTRIARSIALNSLVVVATEATTTAAYGIVPQGILSERVIMIEAVAFPGLRLPSPLVSFIASLARPLAFVAAWGPRFTVGNRRPNIPGPAYPITGLSESVTFSLAPHLGSAPTIPVIFGNLIGVGISNSSRDFDRGFV